MTSLAANGTDVRRETLVDAALALPLAALAIGGTAGELVSATASTPPAFGGYLIAVVVAVTLTWRRQRPAVVAVAALTIAACYPLIGYPGWAPMVPLFVALYSLTAYGATQRALYGALALCVIAYLLPVVSTQRWSPWSPAVWAPAIGLVWVSLLGASTRRRRFAGEEHLRQVAEIAAAQARERMADERLQVARELHDVLAHTISVIAVQSGLAVDALDDDTDTTRTALGAIRASTKEALAELRATLTLLRADSDEAAARPTRPQPRLADLPDLVAQTRAAGPTVTLECEVDARLAPAVERTVFRVAQESLTNVVRHARATTVAVTVRRDADQLLVTVVDDGRGPGRRRTRFRRTGNARARVGTGRHARRRARAGAWVRGPSRPAVVALPCQSIGIMPSIGAVPKRQRARPRRPVGRRAGSVAGPFVPVPRLLRVRRLGREPPTSRGAARSGRHRSRPGRPVGARAGSRVPRRVRHPSDVGSSTKRPGRTCRPGRAAGQCRRP